MSRGKAKKKNRRRHLTDEEKRENRKKLIASFKDESTKQFTIREFAKLGLFQ